jgi:protein associated with RNAse G/E
MTLWNEGDNVILRGVYEGRPVYVQSARVVKDTPTETALLVWPGAQCMVANGYMHHAHSPQWDRWHETMTDTLNLQPFTWHTNRFLILLEPEKFYSTIYIWEAATDRFDCYYVNFQLPFRRTRLGFDSLDLDLDIIIEADYSWKWKDVDEYQHAIRVGGIRPEWVSAIERARAEVAARFSNRAYPLNGAWLNWCPDPNWAPPSLPVDWDSIL